MTGHELHIVAPGAEPCAACHDGVTGAKSLALIRKSKAGHDGDVTEGIAARVTALRDRRLAAIQTYGKDTAGAAIAYHGHAHPHFFNDRNGNGKVDDVEAMMDNKFASRTPADPEGRLQLPVRGDRSRGLRARCSLRSASAARFADRSGRG